MTAIKQPLTLDQVRADGIYTTKQVADLFGFDTSTIGKWIRDGVIRTAQLPGQHRFVGAEILRIAGPSYVPPVEPKVGRNKRERAATATLETAKQ